MIWLYVLNPESGGVSPGPIILSNTAHARRSSCIVSVASTACSKVSEVHAGSLSRGVGPARRDPLFRQHRLCTRSRSSWPKTSAPSRSSLHRWHRMNVNSSIIHRNILGLCPLRSVRHVFGGLSLVYAGCIEVADVLSSQPSPHGFLGHVIGHAKVLPVYLEEEGWCELLHRNFCRLCLTDYSAPPFMPRCGLFQRIPFSYWFSDDVTPLPAEALPPPGEPTNQGCSHPDAFLYMCYVYWADYSVLHFSSSF